MRPDAREPLTLPLSPLRGARVPEGSALAALGARVPEGSALAAFGAREPGGGALATFGAREPEGNALATCREFRPEWRRLKARAFDPWLTSSAGATTRIELWGKSLDVYANANFSIYSAQGCPGACGFCVEKLRPASRGRSHVGDCSVEPDDGRFFAALEGCLEALRSLDPSVSVTGGEPTLDPRLPRLLRLLQSRGMRKRTMTTNGVGLLDRRDGRRIVDWTVDTGVRHLNLSRAHPSDERNAEIMGVPGQLDHTGLRQVVEACRAGGTRVRLSCVLLRGGVESLEEIRAYLAWAQSLGVDNVVLRQLMRPDHATASDDPVVRYSDSRRVALAPLLEQLGDSPDFTWQRQVVGYYYYVEVWRWHGIDVVLEEADLSWLEASKHRWPDVVFELVFHPGASLASTWQAWDGQLGPPR